MSCEVVKSMANWTEFEYCRTHRCEPKNCPRGGEAKKVVEWPDLSLSILEALEKSDRPIFNVFKVGDQVKTGFGACYSVIATYDDGSVDLEHTDADKKYLHLRCPPEDLTLV